MIQLPGGYCLRADKYEITLCTKRKRGRFDVRGHYTTLSGALDGWRRNMTRDIVGRDELQEMRDVLSELHQLEVEANRMIGVVDSNGWQTEQPTGTQRQTAPEADTELPEDTKGDCKHAA